MALRFVGSGRLWELKVKALAAATGTNVEMDITETIPAGVVPVKRAPVLLLPNGSAIGGCGPICRYLAGLRPELNLLGGSYEDRAQVDYIIDTCRGELSLKMCCKDKRGDMLPVFKEFDTFLSTRTFLVGERMTWADIDFVCTVSIASHAVKLAEFPHIRRLFETVNGVLKLHMPFGEGSECASGVCDAKGAAPCEAAKAAPTEAAKAAPTEAAKSAKPMDPEELEKPEKKKPNPLDSLPPTSMDMDAWKRCYSNIKSEAGLRSEAMDYLWSNFDASGWSFWFCENIKGEGEGTQDFMSSNMAKGYLQCIEPNFRKYSFGILDVVGDKTDPNGTSGNFDIKGVFMVRGHELPAELGEHRSAESWKYRKMDHVAEKQTIIDYFCSFDKVDGKTIFDSKVWK